MIIVAKQPYTHVLCKEHKNEDGSDKERFFTEIFSEQSVLNAIVQTGIQVSKNYRVVHIQRIYENGQVVEVEPEYQNGKFVLVEKDVRGLPTKLPPTVIGHIGDVYDDHPLEALKSLLRNENMQDWLREDWKNPMKLAMAVATKHFEVE